MYCRWFVAILILSFPPRLADAGGVPSIKFVDGRWHGDIATVANGAESDECWAGTRFDDGTTLVLAIRRDGNWRLQLSNPDWRLPHPHRYVMDALVDFYPQLHIMAETKDQTRLDIVDLDHITLLKLIENGHTIDLTSEGFNEKYELEGSAKVIERTRNCYASQLGVEAPVMENGQGK